MQISATVYLHQATAVKTAGAKHIVANRFIAEISGKLKPEDGSESDEHWQDLDTNAYLNHSAGAHNTGISRKTPAVTRGGIGRLLWFFNQRYPQEMKPYHHGQTHQTHSVDNWFGVEKKCCDHDHRTRNGGLDPGGIGDLNCLSAGLAGNRDSRAQKSFSQCGDRGLATMRTGIHILFTHDTCILNSFPVPQVRGLFACCCQTSRS